MRIANVLENDTDADLLRPQKKTIFREDLFFKIWFVLNLLGVIWWIVGLQRKKSGKYKYALSKKQKKFL